MKNLFYPCGFYYINIFLKWNPMPSNQELQSRKESATPRGVGVMTQICADRAENAELWDVEGRRYIDFAAGIAVLNTGHRHPKLIAAMQAQLQRFTDSYGPAIFGLGCVSVTSQTESLGGAE